MLKLSVTQRRWLLSFHLIFVAILLGVSVAFIILSIVAGTTNDVGILKACYLSMHILAETSIRASTIGTVVTGILLSLLTSWGLFKYWWILVKEILTIFSIVVGIVGIYFWSLNAVTITSEIGLHAFTNSVFVVNEYQLWTGIILQVIFLVMMTIISVFKPWGKMKQR